jgi:FlaG/FlaF family flagellin (archaellin)
MVKSLLAEREDAVSPVIGVILTVVIIVILENYFFPRREHPV